jgi:hypothetical protein
VEIINQVTNHLAGTLNTQQNEYKKLMQKVNMIEVMDRQGQATTQKAMRRIHAYNLLILFLSSTLMLRLI